MAQEGHPHLGQVRLQLDERRSRGAGSLPHCGHNLDPEEQKETRRDEGCVKTPQGLGEVGDPQGPLE